MGIVTICWKARSNLLVRVGSWSHKLQRDVLLVKLGVSVVSLVTVPVPSLRNEAATTEPKIGVSLKQLGLHYSHEKPA